MPFTLWSKSVTCKRTLPGTFYMFIREIGVWWQVVPTSFILMLTSWSCICLCLFLSFCLCICLHRCLLSLMTRCPNPLPVLTNCDKILNNVIWIPLPPARRMRGGAEDTRTFQYCVFARMCGGHTLGDTWDFKDFYLGEDAQTYTMTPT